MVDTDDTRNTTDDRRRTMPRVWHKLPTGELILNYNIMFHFRFLTVRRQALSLTHPLTEPLSWMSAPNFSCLVQHH